MCVFVYEKLEIHNQKGDQTLLMTFMTPCFANQFWRKFAVKFAIKCVPQSTQTCENPASTQERCPKVRSVQGRRDVAICCIGSTALLLIDSKQHFG